MPSRMPRAIGFAYFSAGQTPARRNRRAFSLSTKHARWPSILRDYRNCSRSSEPNSPTGAAAFSGRAPDARGGTPSWCSSTDLREPRPRCQDERKISLHIRIEAEVESRESAQQFLFVKRKRVTAADEKFRRRHDIFPIDDAQQA